MISAFLFLNFTSTEGTGFFESPTIVCSKNSSFQIFKCVLRQRTLFLYTTVTEVFVLSTVTCSIHVAITAKFRSVSTICNLQSQDHWSLMILVFYCYAYDYYNKNSSVQPVQCAFPYMDIWWTFLPPLTSWTKEL